MTSSRIRALWPLAVISATTAIAACRSAAADPPAARPTPVTVISGPPATGLPSSGLPSAGAMPEASEPYVDMVMVDAPVRLVLQRLAEIGKLDLVIPANLNRTISVQYVHVPVSVALRDVLSRSGLRLGTGSTAPLPFDTVTVFYKLPANVDSMSADAIMVRFGVSRAIADLIVRSRPPR